MAPGGAFPRRRVCAGFAPPAGRGNNLVMSADRALPVLMPAGVRQNWSCHSCARCCRELVGHLFEEDRQRIDRHDWRAELGVEPYVQVRGRWVLNKRADGACVFLDERGLCRIHAKFGEAAKPVACRIFPFSVRPVEGGWRASLRFDCPSVRASQGQPILQHRGWLAELCRAIPRPGQVRRDTARLGSVHATVEEMEAVHERIERWLRNNAVPMGQRVIGLARLAGTLSQASFEKVRGGRVGDLLDILLQTLPVEAAEEPAPPAPRQQGMLRQLAFAHAEHVTLDELRAGVLSRWGRRWRQLRAARRFRHGAGMAPRLPGYTQDASFAAIEAVRPAGDEGAACAELLQRYLIARVEGRTICGEGYYGWGVVPGLAALCAAVAAAGWLARYHAAVAGREELTFENVGEGLAMVDRAATRAPALGTVAERARLAYLIRDDGLARVAAAYGWSQGIVD